MYIINYYYYRIFLYIKYWLLDNIINQREGGGVCVWWCKYVEEEKI
jgi:hypothetical protein